MLFEEPLELFLKKDVDSILEKNHKRNENLGQVFTSPILAKFMIQLLQEYLHPSSSILDPCIGPNTFFKNLPAEFSNCHLTGIEIDENLINKTTKKFYKNPKRTLIEGSFFDLEDNKKFDLIIENPPYVRQELLVGGVNSKENIKNQIPSISRTIPLQSNLYIYFLLKSILHLKEGGVMVAVIYDSWLYSGFGKFLKESFIKLGHLSAIYHFKKSAFDSIEVGATVIKFIKSKDINKSTLYYSLTDLNDLKNYDGLKTEAQNISSEELANYFFNNKSKIEFKSIFFQYLTSVVSQPIQRGTSAIINNHFIFDKKIYPELRPIIKNVSQIKTYQVISENAFVLVINGSISDTTKEYLESVKNKILKTPIEKYKAIKQNIAGNKEWYKIKTKSSANFIFNYYLRNNIDFIYNPKKYLFSDNFYAVDIKEEELVYLSILNSSFTRLNILNNSRSQGNGLRKIQLYEFKKVSIINIKHLSKQTIEKLTKLAKSLMISARYKKQKNEIIEQIDIILLKEYNHYNNSSVTIQELKAYIRPR